MKIYSYTDSAAASAKGLFNDESPLQFQQGFSEFYQKYYNNSVSIIYSPAVDAYIPVRYFKVKVFRFAQILHAPIRNNREISADDQQVFFDELISFHRMKQLCQRFIQPHPYGMLQAVPEGAQSCQFGTYITNLNDADEESLLAAFDSKYRKSVNHSMKNGATVKFGRECFQDFYTLYKGTTSKAGIYCDPVNYFETIYQCLGDSMVETGVVYDGVQPVGGVFIIYTKYSALCTHAGSGGDTKLYGAMKMLHYKMMLHLKNKGVRYYDLVGVRVNSNNEALEGIFRFKKGFGGELKTGYLWKMDIAPLQTKMYDLLMRIKNRNIPIRDIIDEETN